MKKTAAIIFAIALICVLCAVFVACDDNETAPQVLPEYSLEAEGELYTYGEQTVSLSVVQSLNGVAFKSDISADDVAAAGSAFYKTVKAVRYVSAKSIEVTFEGSPVGSVSGEAEIVVYASGMTNGIQAKAKVTLLASEDAEEYTLDGLYQMRADGTEKSLVGHPIAVKGKVTAVETVSVTSTKRFFIQSGSYGMYATVTSGAEGYDLVTEGACVVAKGIVESFSGGGDTVQLAVSNGTFNGSVALVNEQIEVATVDGNAFDEAGDFYLFNGSAVSFDMTVTAVQSATRYTVTSAGGVEMVLMLSSDVTVTANEGDTLTFDGSLLVSYSAGTLRVYVRNASFIA